MLDNFGLGYDDSGDLNLRDGVEEYYFEKVPPFNDDTPVCEAR